MKKRFLPALLLALVVAFLVFWIGAKLAGSKTSRKVLGHAWVTLRDEPYYEDMRLADYQTMFVLPRAAA